MATAYQIQVPSSNSGILKFDRDPQTADTVSELLQKDLDNHHVFFNTEGFHNHIPHHLLTLYGTGAQPSHLQNAFATNASYQIRATAPKSDVLSALQEDYAAAAPEYFGKGKHYSAFLAFYQQEIEARGWRDVLAHYVFREDDERAMELFARLYAGFLHPMIQLMFGVEWEQPAIVAEALAQAAVHEDRLGEFLRETERRAAKYGPMSKSLTDMFEDLRRPENGKLAGSASFSDPNKIYDGVMKRAPEEALEYAGAIKVKDGELEERTAEMFHNSAYVAAAAAWHPPHIPKYDFFLIHHLNSAPIFLTLNKADWVPRSSKLRLLEWKMRLDLLQYVARGCPPLRGDILHSYVSPEGDAVRQPRDLLPRFHAIEDDGHTIKVVRALLIAQELTAKFAYRDWVRVKDEGVWLKMHLMLLEAVEGGGERWTRSAGFEEAWKDVPERK